MVVDFQGNVTKLFSFSLLISTNLVTLYSLPLTRWWFFRWKPVRGHKISQESINSFVGNKQVKYLRMQHLAKVVFFFHGLNDHLPRRTDVSVEDGSPSIYYFSHEVSLPIWKGSKTTRCFLRGHQYTNHGPINHWNIRLQRDFFQPKVPGGGILVVDTGTGVEFSNLTYPMLE